MIYILIIILAFILLFIYCCLKISRVSEVKEIKDLVKNTLGIRSPSKELLDMANNFRVAALPLCGDDNVNYFLQKMDNLEIDNKHQKKVIDRLSRKIQKLRAKIRESEHLSSNDVLNLNVNATNQAITFHGRTYKICRVILKQEIGSIDVLLVISHDVSGDLYDKK